MNEIYFENYIRENPNWKAELGVYQRDSAKYQRIKCIWEETLDNNEVLKHEYHAVINVKTGEIFLDCRRRKIFVKDLCLIAARPIVYAIKTLWHASIIGPLALEIRETYKGNQTQKTAALNTVKSLMDIVRTPLYGTAMVITQIFGTIIGIFAPNTLYYSRDMVGKLGRAMLRVDRMCDGGVWAFDPCFSPFRNLVRNGDNQEDIKKMLSDFAEGAIDFRRKFRAPFNDFFHKFPAGKTYISAAATTRSGTK